MAYRILRAMSVAAVVSLVLVTIAHVTQTSALAQQNGAEPQAAETPRTPWGEPDLQGIWSIERLVPLQRPAGVTTEFYTEEQVAELDRERLDYSVFGNHLRAEPGSEADVAGAYNAVVHVAAADRSADGDGHRPAGWPGSLLRRRRVQERQAVMREYQVALLQNTIVCRDGLPGCRGGQYGPPSPRRAERPPFYSTSNINRADGPEDRSLGERCMSGRLPHFRGGFTGVFRRVVQSPGVVTMFYDSGQGQGWNRVIPITDAPHLPSHVRQWWGDSRALWEGDTLVVDVTNFSSKTDYQGSRENLHLVERWTRTGPDTMELITTLEDPAVWDETVDGDPRVQHAEQRGEPNLL